MENAIISELVHHKRMALAAIALIIMFSLFFTRPATITGHFTLDTFEQKTNLEGQGSTAYKIDSPLPLNSFRISGRVEGPGLVYVYLAGEGTKKLVYSNEAGSTSKITGLAAGSTSGVESSGELEALEGATEILKFTEIEPILPTLQRTGFLDKKEPYGFRNHCEETCYITPDTKNYELLIQTEPGTRVLIQRARYTIVEI